MRVEKKISKRREKKIDEIHRQNSRSKKQTKFKGKLCAGQKNLEKKKQIDGNSEGRKIMTTKEKRHKNRRNSQEKSEGRKIMTTKEKKHKNRRNSQETGERTKITEISSSRMDQWTRA